MPTWKRTYFQTLSCSSGGMALLWEPLYQTYQIEFCLQTAA